MASKAIYRKLKKGYCRICGNYCSLTYDHIPPKKCFNDSLIYVNKPYKIQIDKGLKIRSICSDCNNHILGGNVDNELKIFMSEIDKYYKLYYKEGIIFREAIIKINKEKILKSILGHIIACYGTQEDLLEKFDTFKDCYSNRMRKYVLGEENNFYNEIRVVFWLHPYRSIRIIPNIVFTELYDSSSSLGGSLFSFYPIGIFIINRDEYSILKNFNLNEIIINGDCQVKINIKSIQDEDFPFSLLKNNSGIGFLYNRALPGFLWIEV